MWFQIMNLAKLRAKSSNLGLEFHPSHAPTRGNKCLKISSREIKVCSQIN